MLGEFGRGASLPVPPFGMVPDLACIDIVAKWLARCLRFASTLLPDREPDVRPMGVWGDSSPRGYCWWYPYDELHVVTASAMLVSSFEAAVVYYVLDL